MSKMVDSLPSSGATPTSSPVLISLPLMSSERGGSGNDDVMKDKDTIIEFAELHSVNLASERFGLSKNVIKSWMKQKRIPIKPVYNSPGQGRKITYSHKLDSQIADHVRGLIDKGERVSVHDICTYARKLIQEENPDFTASTGWAQRFLQRHNIDLSHQLKKLIPLTRQSNGGGTSSPSDNRGRPLSYSAQLDISIADWVRQRTEKGDSVTNSELRKYAKDIITKENSNFTGSASWAQNFLLRHRLSLQPSSLSATPTTGTPSNSTNNKDTTNKEEEEEDGRDTEDAAQPSTLLSHHSTLNEGGGAGGGVEDSVSSTLALLASEGLPSVVESHLSQGTGLTLSDLTSDSMIVDLLNTTAQDSSANFSSSSLETSAAYLTLGQHLSELVSSVNNVTSQSALEMTTPTRRTPQQSGKSQSSSSEGVGSGTRPLSYTKETDQVLANWVKTQQANGEKVTFSSLRSYAKKVVSSENPHFNASVGWVTPFLLRHNLDLKINDKRIKSNRKTPNPRKLASKEEGEEEEEQNGAEGTGDEEDIDMLGGVVPALDESFPPTQLTQDASSGELQSQEEVVMATQVSEEEVVTQTKPVKNNTRSRHTLAEKLEVVRLMRENNLAGHYVSRLLGIATSTLSGWIKLVDQKGAELETLSTNRKRSNRSGQGRPLTYSRDKDDLIAEWVRQQQEGGVPVTASDLSAYASSIIGEENSNFVASVGWRHKFLQRHGLQLQQMHSSYKAPDDQQQSVPIPVQTEEVVCTDEFNIDLIDKVLPSDIVAQVIAWTKEKLAENGSLSVQQFCKHSESLILPVDPMFVATLGWAFKFLHTNGLFLDPKPVTMEIGSRKRCGINEEMTPLKKPCTRSPPPSLVPPPPPSSILNSVAESLTTASPVDVSTNLCQALLSLSNQVQQQQQEPAVVMETPQPPQPELTPSSGPSTGSGSKSYFGKTARDFSPEEKEEVVRYANATTLQKAALRYGVAAPTVWRWRMELKLHQPKYTPNQKKYIVKFAETNSLKDASQRFGITTKTIQNWRRSLQLDGTLSDVEIAAIPPPLLHDVVGAEADGLTTPTNSGLMTEEVIPLDNSHFQYVVDGGEVAEGTRGSQGQVGGVTSASSVPSSLEVTHEVQVQDVGMEYDVISSEGHAAKPRCTPEEKTHILQYALEHSIREASVKYGVSPGTLYYWKKNHQSGGGGAGAKNNKNNKNSSDEATSTNLETTVVSVPMTMDILAGAQGLMQGHAHQSPDPLQALSSEVLVEGGVPTASLIAAITQTLTSATPEQLQSLQQITTDLNLLQAVTSLMNTSDNGGGGAIRQATPTDGLGQSRESISEGISSPTDVLVSFNPLTTPTNGTEIVTEGANEEVAMAMEEAVGKNPNEDNATETEN